MSAPEHVILFREDRDTAEEFESACKWFEVKRFRSEVPAGVITIPRYSALPFYRELEADLSFRNSSLINTVREHEFCANIIEWYSLLSEFTPKTWFRLSDIRNETGPFVLKGATNSRKHLWNTHMFAETFEDAVRVHSRLTEDTLIGDQNIVVRKYEKLVTAITGIRGLPITREYRCFFLYGKLVACGYYWSSHADEVPRDWIDSAPPREFLDRISAKIADFVTFFVVDVAQKENGDWIVVEVNDGQQSGLSTISPDAFYASFREIIDAKYQTTPR